MLKKTLTYKTFNGDEVTEDFYFNLSKPELLELEANYPGGYGNHLKAVAEKQDQAEMLRTFKELLRLSYGRRSEDGKRLVKSDAIWEEFTQTTAYEDIFMDIGTNAESAASFFRSVLPQDLDKLAEQISTQKGTVLPAPPDTTGATAATRYLTRQEAIEMDGDELQSGLATGRYIIQQ